MLPDTTPNRKYLGPWSAFPTITLVNGPPMGLKELWLAELSADYSPESPLQESKIQICIHDDFKISLILPFPVMPPTHMWPFEKLKFESCLIFRQLSISTTGSLTVCRIGDERGSSISKYPHPATSTISLRRSLRANSNEGKQTGLT